MKFSLIERKRFFSPLKYAILGFGQSLNNQISCYQGDDILLNGNNTELKRSSKIFFSVSEQHRCGVVG